MAIQDSYKFIKDATLRGTYQSAEVTVTFYDYYGSKITAKTVQSGTTLSSASSGVSYGSGPSGYIFKGGLILKGHPPHFLRTLALCLTGHSMLYLALILTR